MMRAFVASSLGIAAGIFGFTASAAFTSSTLAAALIAILVASLLGLLAYKRPIVPLDEAACSRALKVIAVLATLAALVQLARLAVFIVAPSQAGFSSLPASDWEVRHSCLSAYYVAAEAVSSSPNIYAESLYSLPDDDPTAPRKPRRIGIFNIDTYEYPPTFLLLPRALGIVAPDFLRHRMLWFALDGGFVLLVMVVVARALGPTAGTRALLLSPLVWVALPTLGMLQKGNVQPVVIAAGLLAMALFERRRWAAGGALLGFAIVSKLYPGLLLVYLLARREWRAVAWTAAASVAFIGVSLLDIGWAPYAAFIDQLPGLMSGEAFAAFRRPAATAMNFSVPGLVFKLKLFGIPGMSFGTMRIVGWVYTLVALAVVVAVARRPVRDDRKPIVWLAILILATFRSPFLPQAYAAFPPLWLLTLVAAMHAPSAKTLLLTLLAWAALNVYWPIDWPIDTRLLAIVNVVPQATAIAIVVLALASRSLGPTTPLRERPQ